MVGLAQFFLTIKLISYIKELKNKTYFELFDIFRVFLNFNDILFVYFIQCIYV